MEVLGIFFKEKRTNAKILFFTLIHILLYVFKKIRILLKAMFKTETETYKTFHCC